mgnify:CR=1 FL=1
MDTGKLNNTIFYEGYEGEGEIILSLSDPKNKTTIHVWDGYFEDIFGNPIKSDAEWIGFTKDYQESVRTFDGEERIAFPTLSEYLSDLKNYENHSFSYPESRDCLNLLISFFEKALSASLEITVTIL